MVILDYEKSKQLANFINLELDDVQSNDSQN